MIQFFSPYKTFKDPRGFFEGIVNTKSWQEINYFSTLKNQIRGNHYHQFTDELFYIIDGKIKIVVRSVLKSGKLDDNIEEFYAKKGDIFIIEKMTHHYFEIITDSIWINALTLKMNFENPDIIRVI